MSHKVAAIQMTSGIDLKSNLEMAKALLAQAASEGASLAVLPEMFPLLGNGAEFTWAKNAIQEQPGHGPIQDFIASEAKRHGIWIVAGTIPLASEFPEKSYASSIIFDDRGNQIARYDKLHLFDARLNEAESYKESDSTVPGNNIVVVDTPVGKLGMSVCYDLRFPELYREMFSQGAELFAVPAAFTVPTGKAHWEILMRAAAVQNFAYVIGAAQYGVHGMGRETYGDSMIVAPGGEIISRLPKGPGVITAEIDLGLVAQYRHRIPVGAHQRIQMDCGTIE